MTIFPPVGGTTAAAIIGKGRMSPFDAYLRLIGEAPPFPNTYRMRRGLAMEDFLAQEYANLTGKSVAPLSYLHPDWPKNERGDTQIVSSRFPWLTGSPDKIVVGEEIGIDWKVVASDQASDWGKPGTDQVPIDYLVQCAWYMAGMEWPLWHIFAEVAGRDPAIWVIERDLELEEALLDTVHRFLVDHVLKRVPPDMTGSRYLPEWVKRKWPHAIEKPRVLTDAIEIGTVCFWLAAKQEAAKINDLDPKVRAIIGASQAIEVPDGPTITYYNNADGTRVLRIKERKD